MTSDKKRAKLLVFSDSHGDTRFMADTMRLHAPSSDIIIHLGDGTDDLGPLREKYTGAEYLCIAGNHENHLFGVQSKKNRFPSLLFREICGLRLMLCHGHRYGVKYGYETLIAAAYKEKADIVLFGHTHQSYQQYIPCEKSSFPEASRNLRIFCPGSISIPVVGLPSYGIIDIRENGILMTNAECS